MDFRQLEMVVAVADNSSFTRAGQQLHVAQSAISRKVKMLEDELGERLFARVSKKVYLTPAGETMLRYARRIFQDLRNASLEISEIATLKRGQLRIGAGMIACVYMLPPVLEKFKALYPHIELQVVTGPTDTLLPMLRDNLIEVGVLTLPIRWPDLKVVPLCKEELVVVTSPKNSKLSVRRWMRPEEIQEHPLITFPSGAHTRNVVEDFFRQSGISPRIALEAESVAMIKPLVAIDLGISIIPLRAVAQEVKRKELHFLRIRGHKITRGIGLVYHNSDYVPTILAELIRLLKEAESRVT
jgi:DNA-binding transcriptional LysR family regulator